MTSRILKMTVASVVLAVGSVSLAACGGGSDDGEAASSADRTVEIEMRDIAFAPNRVEVRSGESIRFVFRNVGKVDHDAFIGDETAQDDHEMEMRKSGSTDMDGMDHGGGSDEGGITVKPGKTGELTHTFQGDDDVLIGCHQAGHYAAGMKITLVVS